MREPGAFYGETIAKNYRKRWANFRKSSSYGRTCVSALGCKRAHTQVRPYKKEIYTRLVRIAALTAATLPVIPAASPLVPSVCPSVTKPAALVKLSFINGVVKASPGAIAAIAVSS